MRGTTVEGPAHYAQDLTHLIDKVDLPGLIGAHFPESGCQPGTAGSFKAVWRGDEKPSGSVYRNEQGAWLWRDHGADAAGSAYHFLRDVLNMDRSKAAQEIKRLAGATFVNNNKGKREERRIVATYDYVDEQGELLFQALRYEPKGFSQRRPDGKGGWLYNLQGVTLMLFRLPRVLEAVEGGRAVYVVEGERDVLTLEAQGVTATCNPMGAGKWRSEYSETLKGAHVILLPDNDEAGRSHARKVAYSLVDQIKSLRLLSLPDLPDKGDVSDWLATGRTANDLKDLAKGAPTWQPGHDLEAFLEQGLDESDTLSWPDAVQDLPPLVPAVPTLPREMLPEVLRDWVDDAAERACVHREFIAIPALVSLGAVIGRRIGIYPKERDNWLSPANLWGAIVGLPSTLKTVALNEGIAPLRRLAAQARQAHEEAQAEHAADIEIIKLDIEKLKRQAKDKKNDAVSIKAELVEKLQALDEAEPPERRYIINDSSIEKIGELLKDNPNGLLYLRDEIIGLLKTCEKPGHEGDRAFLLEAWNGRGSFTYDRIMRGTLHIPALTLSIMGGIQPGRLGSYIKDAIRGESEADGLLQRFQLLVWPDRPPPWKRVDRYPDAVAKEHAYSVFEALDVLEPNTIGAVADAYDPDGIPALRFDAMAQELFNAWLDDLMERLRSDELERTPAFQAHLAKYPSLMPKLALVFHLVDVVQGKASGPVSAEAANHAINWCDFLEAHARKVYAAELNSPVQAAHLLAEKIKEGEVNDGSVIRDIYRRHWAGLETPEQVGVALKVLEDRGWTQAELIGTGGRSKTVLRLHPKLRASDG